ncbi:MAG: aminomethyltransferase family protein [Anaerolineales bacterium]
MPIPTPFHPYSAPLCESYQWRDWSGYLAASSYEIIHDREYYAIRNAAAMIDVSPLFKYELQGPDALQLADRIMTRDITQCKPGQVMYSPWCDDDGFVIDDGTISRLDNDRFRITAAHPNLAWFQDCGMGMDVQVTDVSAGLAALALQGPNSRKILRQVVNGIDLESLRYYRLAHGHFNDGPITVSRTGYTGDLGYELWVDPDLAGPLWERLVQAGAGYGIQPAGMLALDIARIEAGLLLIDVDYISARKALIPDQKSTPFDLGLSWTVDLEHGDFVGRRALQEIKPRGSPWKFVGLEVNWESLEALFNAVDLAPQVAGPASRSAVPLYKDGRQIGQATSHTFSPILKKYIALATLETPYAAIGDQVEMEFTIEYIHRRASARVVETPFFNPPRKRA